MNTSLVRWAAGLALGIVVALGTTAPGAAAAPAPATGAPPAAPPSSDPTGTASPPAAPAAGELTVTIAKNCDSHSVDATIHNDTDAAVTVEVAKNSTPVSTTTVDAGGIGFLRVQGVFADPLHLVYTRLDTGAVVGSFDEELFVCARRIDLTIVVVSGKTFTSRMLCPVLGTPRRSLHGQVRQIRRPGEPGPRFTYTPDAGYVGPDRFDYTCNTSAEAFGTVHITVRPAPADHVAPAPPPARPIPPQLPATGTAGLAPQVGNGAGLVLAGALVLWLGRRRRSHR